MLLAIEQGNTNTLFAVHDGADWVAQWRTATESTRTGPGSSSSSPRSSTDRSVSRRVDFWIAAMSTRPSSVKLTKIFGRQSPFLARGMCRSSAIMRIRPTSIWAYSVERPITPGQA